MQIYTFSVTSRRIILFLIRSDNVSQLHWHIFSKIMKCNVLFFAISGAEYNVIALEIAIDAVLYLDVDLVV